MIRGDGRPVGWRWILSEGRFGGRQCSSGLDVFVSGISKSRWGINVEVSSPNCNLEAWEELWYRVSLENRDPDHDVSSFVNCWRSCLLPRASWSFSRGLLIFIAWAWWWVMLHASASTCGSSLTIDCRCLLLASKILGLWWRGYCLTESICFPFKEVCSPFLCHGRELHWE